VGVGQVVAARPRGQVFFNGLGSAGSGHRCPADQNAVVAAAFGFCLIGMRFASLQISSFLRWTLHTYIGNWAVVITLLPTGLALIN
jgi:hypothetical protein